MGTEPLLIDLTGVMDAAIAIVQQAGPGPAIFT